MQEISLNKWVVFKLDSEKPTISVIIPSLNSQDYIKECVESVLNQTFELIEILCVDAGSTDNTLSILKKLAGKDSRIKLFNSDRKSYGYQMNIGLDNSKGEYMAIVESDDFIDKNMFEELYKLAKEYDAEVIKSTFYHYYDYSSKPNLKIDNAKKKLKNVSGSFNVEEQPLFLDGHPSIWAGLYKYDFLKENNIRFMEEKGAGWVDNPFFYETTFQAKRIIYRHHPYYYYRETNPNSSSNSLGDFTIPIRRMLDNLDIVDEYGIDDEFVLKHVYLRAFAYINNILRRDNHEQHMDEVRPFIQKMLLRFDENLVLKHMPQNHIDTYYKFLSPINLIREDNDINISQEDWNLIIKENNYLYSRVSDLDLYVENSKIEIESLKKDLMLIESSKAYNLGLKLAKPIRKFKSLLKFS